MPNWCDNRLTLTGNAEEIKKFLSENLVKDPDGELVLDFGKSVPPPPADWYDNNWYDWNCENWGTKWRGKNAQVFGPDGGGLLATIDFSTAWAPPGAWLEKTSSKYPDLFFHLSYIEPGMYFAGASTAQNGEMNDECGEPIQEDDEGNTVIYDERKGMYYYEESGQYIEDEYFTPSYVNPYA